MCPSRYRRPPVGRTFVRAAALLAFLAQLALLFAAIGEGRRGIGYGEHVDQGGTSSHYVHDEALCAACQARTLHGVARTATQETPTPRPTSDVVATTPDSFLGRELDSTNLSRAPPTAT